MNAPKAGLRDVAAGAGLSKAAVSLALRGHPSIPEKTRERVKSIARRLGYRPDPSLQEWLSRLRGAGRFKTRETLALIDPCLLPAAEGSYRRRLIQGAEKRSKELGFKLDRVVWTSGLSACRVAGILKARGIRGLIFLPFPEPRSLLDFPWKSFAAVSATLTLNAPLLHRVVPYHLQSMRLAVTKLQTKGAGRIGFVVPESLHLRVERQWGFAYHALQLDFPELARLPILAAKPKTPFRLKSWLERHRPDAVILGDDKILDHFPKPRPKAPRPGFVSLGGDILHSWLPRVDQNPEAIAGTAVDLLSGLLTRSETGIPKVPQTILIPGNWVEPGSGPPGRPHRPSHVGGNGAG